MTSTTSHDGSAKAEWIALSAQIAETQAIVGETWTSVDSAAGDCGVSGVQWGIGRLGPGVNASDRRALFERIEAAWQANGWTPTLTTLGGDAPGLQLRYPAAGGFEDGFFVEIGSTVHGTSIGAQTPCARGDVDALNEEQFAYNHAPGVTRPESPTPVP